MLTSFATLLFLTQASPPPPPPTPAVPIEAASETFVALPKKEERLGDKGEIAMTAGIGLSGSFSATNSGSENYSVAFSPSIDWFVIEHLSLGGSISTSYSGAKSGLTSSNTFSAQIGPRIGYVIPISRRFSFWPRLNLSIGGSDTKQRFSDVGPTHLQGLNLATTLYTPFEFEVATHFFLGLGPSLTLNAGPRNANFSAWNEAAQIGFSSSIGGYF